MADIKQDQFSLQYSDSFSIQGIQEANIDLQLEGAPVALGTVYGTVTDGTDPIPNATVKLFDQAGLPYRHTITGPDGRYVLTDIPVGTYSLAAVAEGVRLSSAAGVTLTTGASMEIGLICEADTTLQLGAIAGVLTVDNAQGLAVPLGGGKITLKNAAGTTVAVTYTADDGEFVFYDLEDGIYSLRSSADGYLPAASMQVEIRDGAIVNILMSMVADARTYNGTVSGIIRSKAGKPLGGCFVGLYQKVIVDGKPREQMVAVTKTNQAGKYLFGGVVGGNYVVKAKLEQKNDEAPKVLTRYLRGLIR